MLERSSISYLYILRMTLPVMMGMLAEFIVYIINSAFLSRVDGQSYVASGNAGLIYVSIMMVGYGFAGAAQIIIARRDGEKNTQALASVMWNNFILIAIIHTVLFIAIQIGSTYLFKTTVLSPAIGQKMDSFLSIRSYGIFFSIVELGFFAYYTGRGQTIPVMLATLAQGLTNFIFDYGLIFGKLGMPNLGLDGAAWSTVISDGFAACTYLVSFMLSKKENAISTFYKQKINRKNLSELLKLGVPLIGQGFVSVSSWTVFFFFIEHMGQEQIEISQTIRNFYYICLISVLSFGTTTKTIVSKLLAEEKINEVKPAMRKIIVCSLLCTLIFTHANFLYPQIVVPLIHTNTRLLNNTVLVLQLVSVAMLMFSVSVALTNMISGAGDTKASFAIELISILLYIGMGYLVTIAYPQPIHIVWCIEYVYFCLMILGAYLYIRTEKWKTIKV